MERTVPLELSGFPNSDMHGTSGELTDSVEARTALEEHAIPRCYQWRVDNSENGRVAPYCCSAYCTRCAGLRALDGADPLQPNEWMNRG